MSQVTELAEVRALLVRAVEEKGADYVYPESEKAPRFAGANAICQYVHDGAPSCVIGHVLAYAGVDMDQLHEREGLSARFAVKAFGLWHHEVVHEALNEAQEAQDYGATWGEALEAFDKYVAEWGA